MKMNKLATIFLAATLSMTSGAVLAASSSSQSNNGQSNSSADAGQVDPGAKENVAPNNVDNSNINTGNTNTNSTSTTNSTSGGTLLHPNSSSSTSTDADGMSKEDIHKNTMCKDGRCPDINKKVETGNGVNNDVDTKTDGTTH
ncbi:YbgS-like family protein [Superficieibacter sp.]|uniref:YbgS-like family protein n=1 Tax=Superficieibacter sp. TaxID=2303322 RepID=UPI0028ACC22A|nr:YbgS-like family protein [Superficieibacter sp.]